MRVVVVGAGLSGMFAAVLAARQGADVTLIAEGRGGLGLSSGRIEVWGLGPPLSALSASPPGHPYRRVTEPDLRQAVQAFVDLVASQGLAYAGSLDRNMPMPTPAGSPRPAALAPASQSPHRLGRGTNIALAGVHGFRDFSPHLAQVIRDSSHSLSIAPELPSPLPTSRRDLYATDLALWFDRHEDLGDLADQWRMALTPAHAVVLPAILGLSRHGEVHRALENALGMRVLEIPTLPPSVPGLRLERSLRRAGEQAGVRFVEGSRAIGRVGRRGRRRVADGVAALTRGGMRVHPADSVILAIGGALHGGWVASADGKARESVFGLPVAAGPASEWTTSRLTDRQPYTLLGLEVDREMRPLGADGGPAFENVFAVGGILAGADRTREGSRQGIDLATAFRAVKVALQ